jgi:hypothetical protein
VTAADVIREAADCGYSIGEKDGAPFLRGPKPIKPESLIELCKSHRTELVEEIRRRKSSDGPRSVIKLPNTKELQLWIIQLVKSNRNGMVMMDGVPVGIRDEATALLSDQSAWEKHERHRSWVERASRLRAALEWPVPDD